jgi:hypothetical protein
VNATECVLTRQWSRKTGQLPIDYSLPQGQENLPSEDPFFSHSFTYQENPNVGTPKYHIPSALNDFAESSDLNLNISYSLVVVVFLPHHQTLHLSHQEVNQREFEEEENSQSESEGEGNLQLVLYNPQVMAGNNPNPQPYEPWLLPDVVSIPGVLHDLPKHPEKFLPKFDPEKKDSAEDHVKKFLLAIRLQNV